MEEFFNYLKTSQELQHSGLPPSTLKRRCSAGELMRVRRNVYVPTSRWQEWGDRERCYARHIAFLKIHHDYVLSHVSAALWWGAPLLRLPHKVWVSHPKPSVKSRGDIQVSRDRHEICEQAVVQKGARVTDPLRTAVDCAMTLPLLDALCIVDYLLHKKLINVQDFSAAVSSLTGRGVCNAREVVNLMSPYAESVLETVARYRMVVWGFTPPQEQVQLWVDGVTYRPDFVWEEFKVILEVDGLVKYSGAHGDPTDVLRQQNRRQHQLERLGYRVVRVQWEDVVTHPERLRSRLLAAGVR